jgi:hypothetical protein
VDVLVTAGPVTVTGYSVTAYDFVSVTVTVEVTVTGYAVTAYDFVSVMVWSR